LAKVISQEEVFLEGQERRVAGFNRRFWHISGCISFHTGRKEVIRGIKKKKKKGKSLQKNTLARGNPNSTKRDLALERSLKSCRKKEGVV